jgi:hypothetical protein
VWTIHGDDPTQSHPALTSFGGECRGMLAPLLTYVGALALVATVGVDLLGSMATRQQDERSVRRAPSNPTSSVSHRFA